MSKTEERQTRLVQELITARKKARLSQQELADESGVMQPIIARIEREKVSPNLSTVLKYLEPLGKTLAVVESNKACEPDPEKLYKHTYLVMNKKTGKYLTKIDAKGVLTSNNKFMEFDDRRTALLAAECASRMLKQRFIAVSAIQEEE